VLKHHTPHHYDTWGGGGGVEFCLHTFLTLPLEGNKSSASHSLCPLDRKKGSWMGPRACLNVVLWRKIPTTAKIQTPVVHPVTSLLIDLCSATFYIQKYEF
jgi:hypothetical protein